MAHPDAIDRLSPAVRYQIANGLGWSGLRPVQALSTEAILDGANCVVLAPTAGGKTEAALLPLLSKMDVEDWRGVSVLYVAPIRALLNNQEARLSTLTGLIGRRAGKWHGDVKEPARRRMIDDPPDVLAITPESLEAMLLSTRTPARRFLAHVRAVVIDEVHAFAGDDRGAHLVALLERISRIAEADIQRIGLSATVGDPEAIVAWLSGSSLRPRIWHSTLSARSTTPRCSSTACTRARDGWCSSTAADASRSWDTASRNEAWTSTSRTRRSRFPSERPRRGRSRKAPTASSLRRARSSSVSTSATSTT
jgi:Lhr-like helicase